MRDFINLTKVQVMTLFPKGKKKHRSMLVLGLLYFFIAILIAIYSAMFSLVFCLVNAAEVIPAFYYAITSIVILITTILKTSGLLFNNRDYELLNALPIKTGTIIASRLTAMYLVNLFFTISIMVPAILPIMIIVNPGILFCILYLVSMFFVPLFPLAISTFIGIAISFISSRFRHKSIIMILLSFGALAAVFYFSMTITDISDEQFLNFGNAFMELAKTFYPPSMLYNRALNVNDVNILYFILFVLMSAGAMFLTIAILAPLYKKIYSSLNAKSTKGNYVYKTTKTSSPFMAIYKKELRRYFGCTAYVVNTAVSPLLALVLAVASCFVPVETLLQSNGFSFGDVTTIASSTLPFILSLILCMAPTTASVISLEGKSLWITQTLPIPQYTNMNAKMLVNITITAPIALICSIIFKFSLGLPIFTALICFIVTIAFILFSTSFGLLLNLLSPNFSWVNEAAIVKQSMPVFVSMFACMIISIVCLMITLIFPIPYFITQLIISTGLILLSALFIFLTHKIKIKE